MNLPKFVGGITGAPHANGHARRPDADLRIVWRSGTLPVWLAVDGHHVSQYMAWHDPDTRDRKTSVFVMGSVAIATDSTYGADTSLQRIAIRDVPDAISALYGSEGATCFSRLEGNFSIVLWDPALQTVYLVVDKFGCEDIFTRPNAAGLNFSSTPSLLLSSSDSFDALPAAFLLAQEGFIPSPFSICSSVRAIGRARYIRAQLASPVPAFETVRYWRAQRSWDIPSASYAVDAFFGLLKTSVSDRLSDECALLLGGADSSLLVNIAARQRPAGLVAITGSVKGYAPGEDEIVHAKSMASVLGLEHAGVLIDPSDESLIDDWNGCAASIWTGARVALPVWLHYARRLRERWGPGYSVIAGQLADTLADNNFTSASAGYTLRRAFFSSPFFKLLPILHKIAPAPHGPLGRLFLSVVRRLAGPRWALMCASLLEGVGNPKHFYDGRIFGYGEMPGRSPAGLPMLSAAGFHEVADWYSTNFVAPIAATLTSENFYRQMIDLSMDMVMLHLDSRLLFHLYRSEGGLMQLPFMDARVVNFFGSLPYSARAVYREPKHLIRAQLRRPGMIYASKKRTYNLCSMLPEDILLSGAVGEHFRSLLRELTLPNRIPGLFDIIDESYFTKQINAFCRRERRVNARFISKIAALEVWSRALNTNNAEASVATEAVAVR
jgi:Asparagine synthase/Glutamine amidotransferase domain